MNRIYGKNIRLKTLDCNGDEFNMAFASGAAYCIKRADYAKNAISRCADSKTDAQTCESIARARNEYISANTRKGLKPVHVKGVVIERADPFAGDGAELAGVPDAAWEDFMFKWGDQLRFGGETVFEAEGSSEAIYEDLKSWAYTQYGKNLSQAKPGKNLILIDEGAPAYYYTNGKTCNGYEVWHKAVDPFSFFGTAAGKQDGPAVK